MRDKKKKKNSDEDFEYYAKHKESQENIDEYNKSINTTSYLKTDLGETIVRIIPRKGKKTIVMIKKHNINFGKKFAGMKCTEDESCIGCRITHYLNAKGDSESMELGKTTFARKRYLCVAYDRLHKKVGILEAPNELGRKIINGLSHKTDLFSITKGNDLIIVKTKDGSAPPRYTDSSIALKASPLISSKIKESMSDDEKERRRAKARKRMMEILAEAEEIEIRTIESKEAVANFIKLAKDVIDWDQFKKWEKTGEIDRDDDSDDDFETEEPRKKKKPAKDDFDEDENDEDEEEEEEEEEVKKSSEKKKKTKKEKEREETEAASVDDDFDDEEEEENKKKKPFKNDKKKKSMKDDFDEDEEDNEEEDDIELDDLDLDDE
jgi:hypothetical protein